MELEIKKLNALKKFTGSFDFDYSPSEDLSLVPLSSIAGKVKVFGEYEIFDDDSVEIVLNIRYKLKGKCSYCLSEAEKEIDYSSEILFVPVKDDDNYYYDGVKIKLNSAVDDAILISQPNVLLCKEGCKGIDVI